MTKITKRDNFNAIINVLEEVGRPELVAVMKHELELLEKKNSYKSTKPTANQVANAEIKEEIVKFLDENADNRYTVTELCGKLNIESNQKMTALVNQLFRDDKIRKTIEKRKSYFQAL